MRQIDTWLSTQPSCLPRAVSMASFCAYFRSSPIARRSNSSKSLGRSPLTTISHSVAPRTSSTTGRHWSPLPCARTWLPTPSAPPPLVLLPRMRTSTLSSFSPLLRALHKPPSPPPFRRVPGVSSSRECKFLAFRLRALLSPSLPHSMLAPAPTTPLECPRICFKILRGLYVKNTRQ